MDYFCRVISQSKYNDKQKEILEAALALFVTYGFHGTPTSKIAEKANVANGTLFHYFRTKDELVIALYVDVKEKFTECLNQATAEATTLEGKFKSIFIHSLQWALENKTAFQFIQQFHTSPFLSKISPEEIQKQMRDHFLLIQEGIDAGLIRPLPVDFIYTLIMGHIFSLFQYLSNPAMDAEMQEKIISEAADMLWLMLC